jgi:hypothetical protein
MRCAVSWRYGLATLAAVASAVVAGSGSGSFAAAADCPSGLREFADYQDGIVFVRLFSKEVDATICYPEKVFRQAGVGADGIHFESDDRLAWFRLFQRENPGRRPIGDLMREEAERLLGQSASITYRQTKGNWFVLSGFIGNRIYYRRSVLTEEGAAVSTFLIEFPQEQKPFYENIVTRMSWSFKGM